MEQSIKELYASLIEKDTFSDSEIPDSFTCVGRVEEIYASQLTPSQRDDSVRLWLWRDDKENSFITYDAGNCYVSYVCEGDISSLLFQLENQKPASLPYDERLEAMVNDILRLKDYNMAPYMYGDFLRYVRDTNRAHLFETMHRETVETPEDEAVPEYYRLTLK